MLFDLHDPPLMARWNPVGRLLDSDGQGGHACLDITPCLHGVIPPLQFEVWVKARLPFGPYPRLFHISDVP